MTSKSTSPVRVLADESVDMAVVRALRAAGHDVLAIAELEPSIPDEQVFARAVASRRLLLTEDADFGRYFAVADSPGIVLLRFEARARAAIVQAVVDLFAEQGSGLLGQFSVLEPGRWRRHTVAPTP